ncbi:hypothetical protein PTQ27_05295 [Mannheimia sp. AT1]|uniref:Hemophilus-specific protein n=1 Tax=Mannheimia cairinae TaxID=3025936 RepID=A0ABT5MSN3_9PAST|nr:hypothetical protein [Mannheimia cairinae]MDD0823882.1 hypothetical protein [Mannheimia cairinae]MDD0825198.1 hypothetical protein [Mannheimia cairinae]
MKKQSEQTNEEKVLLEVVLNENGISDLEYSFKYWINSPRTYISDFENKTGLKLWHNQTKTANGKRCTFYTLPDRKTAQKVISYLNHKANLRGETAITTEQEQQILNRFNV